MKSKKLKISIGIVCFAILIGIIAWAIQSIAVDRTVNYTIKAVNLRADSKIGYLKKRERAENGNWVNIWNLVKMNGTTAEELPLYCVQAELGFFDDEHNVMAREVKYNKAFDMKLVGDKEELNADYGDSNLIIAQNESNDIYSKTLWLADNMYVPGKDTAADKIAVLKKAGVITNNNYYIADIVTDRRDILEQAGIISEEEKSTLSDEKINELFYSEFFISDDVMEVVQQLAFWYIIHSDDSDEARRRNYHDDKLTTLYYTEKEEVNNYLKDAELKNYGNKMSWKNSDGYTDSITQGAVYQEHAEILYNYYITEANKIDSSYYGKVSYNDVASASKLPIKVKDSTITVAEDGDNYIVGPYEIERTEKWDFNLGATVSVKNYTVLKVDGDKKVKVNNIKDVVGAEKGVYQFYLQIPKTQDVSKLSVEFNITSNNRLVTLLLGENALAEQPILLVENRPVEDTKSITLQSFDLALRKVITGLKDKAGKDKLIVDSQNVENEREIVVETDKLNTTTEDGKTITTATYKHRKDPVLVETGDIVTYTLIIYNEGDAAGRATQIADALPKGLEFKRVVSGNYEYDRKIGENIIVLKEKSTNTDLKGFDGSKLDSTSIEIECEVTASASVGEQILTNIAFIAEEFNAETGERSDSKTGIDRDSEPSKMPTEVVTGNLSDYKGNSSNKGDLDDSSYFYEGQEDDDDFEKLILRGANFDLALRKFITEVESKDNDGKTITKKHDREPDVDVSKLNKYDENGKLITTAEYNHTKTPVPVKVGDIVTYTIRVYNEGDIDGYVSEITDYLPKWLGFLPEDPLNQKYLWEYKEEDGTRVIRTEITSKESAAGQELYGDKEKDTYRPDRGEDGKLLKAYDSKTMDTLDYIDVQIRCKVIGKIDEETLEPGEKITNIAVITGMTDSSGADIETDRDSTIDYEDLPSDEELPGYKDEEINRGDEYIPGQEDDDDFEKVITQVFDLALRKFITKVDDGKNVTSYEDSRAPEVTKGTGKRDLDYTHPKDPIGVQNGNLVTYTIRVYNEGDIDGYAKEVTDSIPDGLQFYSATVDGEDYRWVMYKEVKDNDTYDFEYEGKKYVKTTNKEEAKLIKTDYLSRDQEIATKRDNLLKAFDAEDFDKNGATDTTEKRNPDYRDLKVTFKVTEPNTSTRILTNIAEITDDEDKDGNEVEDKDSTPGNGGYDFEDNDENEDDIDFDRVKLLYFDLALRKFITEVEGVPVNNRYPQVKPGTDGRDFDYEHTKKTVDVISGDTVIYTIRVYNEGSNAGYASEVVDDLPDGIIFLPEHETNLEHRWKMYKETTSGTADYEYAGKKYVRTDNPEEADIIKTDYLSKEVSEKAGRNSLLKAYDEKKGITEDNPDHRDIKVAFKVTEPNSSDRIIVNTAEISKHQDEDGNEKVVDKDSTPGNGEEGKDEDDIDKEYIKVKEFDLALLKWVSEVSVTQDGKTTITKTGHTAETAKNEDPVLVTIDAKKIDSVVVKFIYDIRVENQGQIEGYAKEIKDHIPDGLVFKQEDNPDWKQIDEKTIVTDALKDVLLAPKETATVRVVLTWVNGSKNLNQKVNFAEISEDYNDWGVPDKDSEPNNWDTTPGEDDDDEAPVLLTLKTGQLPVYFMLGTGILAVLAGGVYLIRKYVYNA